MKLVVGLGNFPPEYNNTRHNFGFLGLDKCAQKFGVDTWKTEKKFFSCLAQFFYEEEKIILCKPQTYMNLSGKAVRALVHFYDIPIANLIVLHDDLDLTFGVCRFREKGSSGGQKGVQSIIEHLSSHHFSRLKFGINTSERAQIPTERFVLMPFSAEEKKILPEILDQGQEKLESFLFSDKKK